MKPPPITPLEAWTCRKIGLADGTPLTRQTLGRYQLKALNRTLAHVRNRSPFYRQKLRDMPPNPLPDLRALAEVPFTTPIELARDPLALLCVSHGRIARAVSLETSGTTGPPKRLFFTPADLELTLDFFRHGMATLVSPGQRVLILLPGEAPYSVGDLLCRALARMDVQGVLMEPTTPPEKMLDGIREQRIQDIVGTPIQLLALVRHRRAVYLPRGQIQTVLLTTDYVPQSILDAVSEQWDCQVYQHYGMTEMGYGGAVDCSLRQAYHLRETDLLFEIVQPDTGRLLPEGRLGEVVFTTLTREGMPLVRYRTGDLATMRPGSCPCGSALRSMGHVQGRLANCVDLGNGARLEMAALDEAMFSLPGVVNFQAELKRSHGQDHLQLQVYTNDFPTRRRVQSLNRAITTIDTLELALASGKLQLSPIQWRPASEISLGPAKRQLKDLREC